MSKSHCRELFPLTPPANSMGLPLQPRGKIDDSYDGGGFGASTTRKLSPCMEELCRVFARRDCVVTLVWGCRLAALSWVLCRSRTKPSSNGKKKENDAY